jgi:hypothetical protein
MKAIESMIRETTTTNIIAYASIQIITSVFTIIDPYINFLINSIKNFNEGNIEVYKLDLQISKNIPFLLL